MDRVQPVPLSHISLYLYFASLATPAPIFKTPTYVIYTIPPTFIDRSKLQQQHHHRTKSSRHAMHRRTTFSSCMQMVSLLRLAMDVLMVKVTRAGVSALQFNKIIHDVPKFTYLFMFSASHTPTWLLYIATMKCRSRSGCQSTAGQ